MKGKELMFPDCETSLPINEQKDPKKANDALAHLFIDRRIKLRDYLKELYEALKGLF